MIWVNILWLFPRTPQSILSSITSYQLSPSFWSQVFGMCTRNHFCLQSHIRHNCKEIYIYYIICEPFWHKVQVISKELRHSNVISNIDLRVRNVILHWRREIVFGCNHILWNSPSFRAEREIVHWLGTSCTIHRWNSTRLSIYLLLIQKLRKAWDRRILWCNCKKTSQMIY